MKIGLALAGALFSCSLLPAQQSPGYTGLGQPPGAAVIGQQTIAQQTDEARGQGGSQPSTRSVLDYLNFYGMLTGIYDSSIPYQTISRTGGVTDYGGAGAQVGGGVDFVHRLRHGEMSAFYNGSYTRYSRSQYTNATQQLLGLSLVHQFSQHVNFTATESLNYSDNLGQSYIYPVSEGLFPSVQPYNSTTLANVTSLTLNWRAQRRVTYFVGGDFYASHYRPSQLTSYVGGDVTAGVTYEATEHDALTGSVSYTRFGYSNGGGNSDIGTVAGSYSHRFNNYWSAGASVGVARVVASGIANLGFEGIPSGEFQQGRFSNTTTAPIYYASISRNFKHSSLSLIGGQSVVGGNGIYLTSKNVYGTANLSIQLSRRLRLGGVGGVNRLSSVANTASGYTSATFGANAAYQLTERCFLNFTYQGWQYPKFGDLQRTYANRVSAGVTFTSRPYPISGF